MQFLLSEEELTTLTEKNEVLIETFMSKLQALCTLAANNVPVVRSWDKDNRKPWGCILDEETDPEYCD